MVVKVFLVVAKEFPDGCLFSEKSFKKFLLKTRNACVIPLN